MTALALAVQEQQDKATTAAHKRAVLIVTVQAGAVLWLLVQTLQDIMRVREAREKVPQLLEAQSREPEAAVAVLDLQAAGQAVAVAAALVVRPV